MGIIAGHLHQICLSLVTITRDSDSDIVQSSTLHLEAHHIRKTCISGFELEVHTLTGSSSGARNRVKTSLQTVSVSAEEVGQGLSFANGCPTSHVLKRVVVIQVLASNLETSLRGVDELTIFKSKARNCNAHCHKGKK